MLPVRPLVHIVLHFLVPAAVARAAFAGTWRRAALVMMATIVVDLDHLLANPLYDPSRCSIGFHPLHTWPAIVIYGIATLFPQTRLVGLGLVIHMALDWSDCLWMGL